MDTFISHWELGDYVLNFDLSQLIKTPIYIVIILAIFGMLKSLSTFWKSTFFARKVQQFILIYVALGMIVSFTNNYSFNFDLFYFAIPLAMYTALLFKEIKRTWAVEVLNGLVLLCVIWFQYEHFLEFKFSDLPSLLSTF